MPNDENDTSRFELRLAAAAFPHPVEQIELLETHISWIVLTGKFAYKIKKPVKFDFLDYTTLNLRKHFCESEVELNRRFAPEIYLGVVPIEESRGKLQFLDQNCEPTTTSSGNASATIVEYAVKMHQFPQDAIVAERLHHPEMTSTAVVEFGKYIANFHDTLSPSAPELESAKGTRITRDAIDNFSVLFEKLNSEGRLKTLTTLKAWTLAQATKLLPEFERRLQAGYVRRCHGDLHLKNIIQIDGKLIAFDGIEFNEAFQWVDVLSEIAFPVMDLAARGRADLAWQLLNAYLEETGDYQNLDVLRFYLVYRCLVRAKVTCLNPKNEDPKIRARYADTKDPNPELAGPWDKYLATALYFAFQIQPKLALTHGFSGSGKSTVAMNIIAKEGGIRIRSDVERHRLTASLKSTEKYSALLNDQVYTHLIELAKLILDSGFTVIVDATFLSLKRRTPYLKLAELKQLEFEIIDCSAGFDELCRRILNRGLDPSEATIQVLKSQMVSHEPLTDEELPFVRANH